MSVWRDTLTLLSGSRSVTLLPLEPSCNWHSVFYRGRLWGSYTKEGLSAPSHTVDYNTLSKHQLALSELTFRPFQLQFRSRTTQISRVTKGL